MMDLDDPYSLFWEYTFKQIHFVGFYPAENTATFVLMNTHGLLIDKNQEFTHDISA